jgi:serine/threonine protein kinase
VAAVGHDNVWPVLDWGLTPSGAPYAALAPVEGETLGQYLRRSGPLDESEVLELGRQLLAGVAACHAQGLVCGCLSPHHVWLTFGDSGQVRVRLVGLGLCGNARRTGPWQAPETAERSPDESSDLYSVAAILLTLLGANIDSLAPTRSSGTGSGIEPLLRRGLSNNPGERPRGAGQFLRALEALNERRPEPEPTPPASSKVKLVTPRRPRPRPIVGQPVSESLLLSPKIPPAAPAPLFDARDATFSSLEIAARSRALSPADTRKKTLRAALVGVMIGVLVAWLAGYL